MLKRVGKVLGLILALQLISCEKSEEKYRELIIGEWGRDIIYSGYNGLGREKIGYMKIKFSDNGYYEIYSTWNDKVESCAELSSKDLQADSLTYYIKEDLIYLQNPFTPVTVIDTLEIKRMNKEKLKIGTEKYTRCN